MRLGLEVAGALGLAALISTVIRGVTLRGGVTVIAVVIGAVAFWSSLWPQAGDLVRRHDRDARLGARQALSLAGAEWGAREDVLAWADRVLPRRANVFLDCPQPQDCSNGLANWITYRLIPRVFTDYPQQARWVLLYGTTALPPGPVRFTVVARYGPGFAIGRPEP